MPIIKKLFILGGWVSTLIGSGTTVWWLEKDQTIEDVLKRTGREILWSNSDFQKLFLLFEDDEQFIKDIEEVEKLEWKAVSEWCKEKLALPINEKNLTEVLPKAQKYCSGNIVVPNGVKDFRNFKKIFGLLKNDNDLDINNMTGAIVHLGDKQSDDVYYSFSDNVDPKEAEINIKDKPKDLLGRQLFIDKKHKILGDSDIGIWKQKIKEYALEENKKERFPDLSEVWHLGDVDGVDNDATGYNLLGDTCKKLLEKVYNSGEEEDFKHEHRLFVKWCTVTNSL